LQVKGLFNKYVLGKELDLSPEDFRDDSVWEKLVNLSLKEWNKSFNEDYINYLLANFDNDKLIFNKNVMNY
jgi:hypothetical protein